MGIAHNGETTKVDEEFNKATTQYPISNKFVEYVHIHVQLTTGNYGIEILHMIRPILDETEGQ